MTAAQSQVKGLKRNVYTEFHDFLPNIEKEIAEYKKAIIQDIDHRSKKKGKDQEEPYSWPLNRELELKERIYNEFVEKVVNEKTNHFYPQKDEDNRAIPNTGAYKTIRSIVRIKRNDDSEYLLSKGDIHAFNSLGDQVKFYVSYPERWNKPLWNYTTQWNDKTKQLEKRLEGPSGLETVYELPFNKENLLELWNQRESDRTIQFICKDEATGKAAEVRDVTGNTQKSFELFRDSDFDFLFKGEYIPEAIKAELRQEALAQGLIGGTTADYQPVKQPPSGKNLYK